MQRRAVIIGSGIGGLGIACLLGKAGYAVTVLEKNDQLGGRAGVLRAQGFTFDMGPSWYLMPEIFEQFFGLLGEDVADHLDLVKLSPSYRVFWQGSEAIDITGVPAFDEATFGGIEAGADEQLRRYLTEATHMYEVAVGKLLHKNYNRFTDLFSMDLLQEARRLRIHTSMHAFTGQYFKDQRLQQILEYPAVFLGASPYRTPAFYSLLNHVLFKQGVYYPRGGIHQLIEVLTAIGASHGVQYRTNANVVKIEVEQGRATGVSLGSETLPADLVISNADPYHTDTQLLDEPYREHSAKYWDTRIAAPSALLLYLGIDRRYDSLLHHNLYFTQAWHQNFAEIFDSPTEFPTDPSLYVCAPSRTDPTVAPKGHENLFVLVPIAPGLEYNQQQLDAFTDRTLANMEQQLNLPGLRKHIVYQKRFCVKDFAEQYNSFRGTSLGLAHTLSQTAVFRPHSKSKKVKNLLHVGGNVHPGIGMPTTLISAELAYKQIIGDKSSHPLSHL